MLKNIEWLQAVATSAQVLFYVAVGTVAVLTYRRARVTVLQPIRTEVFKAQVEQLTRLLHYFVGKSSSELLDEFGLSKNAYGNVMKMAGAYGKVMFDLDPPGTPPWEGPDFPQGVASLRAWRASGFNEDEHPSKPPERSPKDPAIRFSVWSRYIHDDLVLSDFYVEKLKELRDLLESPLMPSKCAILVEEFITAAKNNSIMIGITLTQSVSEFPEQYHTLEELVNANFLWITNRCIGKFEDLKPKAEEIVSYIRNYFDPDRLTDLCWPH